MGLRFTNARWAVALLVFGCLTARATAQQLGTAYIDWNGATATPQGTVSALDASIFPQAAGATFTTAQLRQAILDDVRADYTGLSISITSGNVTTGADDEPTAPFTRIAVGNTGTASTTALGVADQIDFRNKNSANVVSVLASVHANPPVGGAGATYTLAQAAQFVSNTTSHELGHVLGLVHSDVASTFNAAANVAAGQAAVQQSELMKAVQRDADAFRDLSFGTYSKVKLDIDKGINVQRETGAATFTFASAADPTRDATDAGNTVATASAPFLDVNGRTTVLGSLGAADTSDLFKFNAIAGQTVTAEVFSQVLAGTNGRIGDPVDTRLRLVDATGAVVGGQTVIDMTSDLDGASTPSGAGDFGSDQLLYNFTVPATGTYAFSVAQNGADTSGQYELLVIIPEPTGLFAMTAMAIIIARRRRA